MDFGKYRYQQIQKKKEAKKNTVNVSVKEMKFRPKIDTHDYETKLKHIRKFIKQGAKVKCTIMFRGREMAHPEFGRQILDRIEDDLYEITEVELPPQQEGRNMLMVLAPLKKGKKKPAKKKAEEAEPQVNESKSDNSGDLAIEDFVKAEADKTEAVEANNVKATNEKNTKE